MMPNDFFEQIQKHYSHKLPFVVYRKPDETIIKALLQIDSSIHKISNYTESGFVFTPFDDEQSAILIPNSNSKGLQTDVVTSSAVETSHRVNLVNNEQKDGYIKIVQKAIDAIENNKFQKVVLSRKETVELKEENPIHLFNQLLNTYETAFVYCWFHPKVGLWLGATPETLLQIEGNRLTTMALAGTQKFNGTIDVLWESKEREEQQIVTDFIVHSLQSSVISKQSSVGSITISDPQTVRAGYLLHLKTLITATLKPNTLNLKHLLQTIHPTPAVCGFPKEKAKQFILENEDYNRDYYTGFLGELNIKERKSRNSNRHNVENDAYAAIKTVSNLYVNLRCMQLKTYKAILYIGGGITKDSIPEKEWEETVSKSQVIKSIL